MDLLVYVRAVRCCAASPRYQSSAACIAAVDTVAPGVLRQVVGNRATTARGILRTGQALFSSRAHDVAGLVRRAALDNPEPPDDSCTGNGNRDSFRTKFVARRIGCRDQQSRQG